MCVSWSPGPAAERREANGAGLKPLYEPNLTADRAPLSTVNRKSLFFSFSYEIVVKKFMYNIVQVFGYVHEDQSKDSTFSCIVHDYFAFLYTCCLSDASD